MSDLFSHPSAASRVPESRPDVQVSVTVPAPIDHAWAGFIEHLHLWWPSDALSRWKDSFFDLEDKAFVETSADDDEYVWGEVVHSVPGESVELRWRHVSGDSTTVLSVSAAGQVDHPSEGSNGQSTGPGAGHGASTQALTVLHFTHSGWTTQDPAEIYEVYRTLWPIAAQRYLRFMGGA